MFDTNDNLSKCQIFKRDETALNYQLLMLETVINICTHRL